MMCMVRKDYLKEAGMVVPALDLVSCQPMTCSSNSLVIILTFLDQLDLMIHSSVRQCKYLLQILTIVVHFSWWYRDETG